VKIEPMQELMFLLCAATGDDVLLSGLRFHSMQDGIHSKKVCSCSCGSLKISSFSTADTSLIHNLQSPAITEANS